MPPCATSNPVFLKEVKMSFIQKFLPQKETYDALPYKEQQKISNLVIACLACIPGFIAIGLFVIFLYNLLQTGLLLFVPCIFFALALIFIKLGKVRLASYFATSGFIISTMFITFFAPVATKEDELSTFVCFRTCAFSVCIACINYMFALRKTQLYLFHIFSIVGHIVSGFTVYKPAFDNAPTIMISALAINAVGIIVANLILQYAWSFNEKVLERSENQRLQVEELNKNLEKKIEERTKDLAQTNANLEQVNKHLEDMNKKSERDIALAVNVQRNFYPHSAPKVDGWEISYIFSPASGVSGDLFDFYTDGKKLNGLCLFDVSGHGIASALVTMLSKTIIKREFKKSLTEKDKTLAQVMLNINSEISKDKGDIENYLTGILIKIDDDKIDYVNGGHPALLFRSGQSGKVSQVILKDNSQVGSLIGLSGLSAKYTGISFNMKSGDSIMLYTDCLYEARNNKNEQFGTENVIKIFQNASRGSSQEMLSHVIKSFKNFTGEVPLEDDLTCIILKKLD